MSESQKDTIARNILLLKYSANFKIIREGDPAVSFFLIKQGLVSEQNEESEEIRKLGPGEYFGEKSLLEENPKVSASVVVIEPTICFTLSRQSIIDIFGDKLLVTISRNNARIAINRSRTLKGLQQLQIEKIMKEIIITFHSKNEMIVEEFSDYEEVIFVCTGSVRNEETNKVTGMGRIWGEKYLKQENLMEK